MYSSCCVDLGAFYNCVIRKEMSLGMFAVITLITKMRNHLLSIVVNVIHLANLLIPLQQVQLI